MGLSLSLGLTRFLEMLNDGRFSHIGHGVLRHRSSCTQKRATNANSSSHDDSKDTRTARILQGVENAFQPARITK